MSRKRINIQRDFYTMSKTEGDDAEILMYGEIVTERPKNWWTGEPVEGNFIVLNEFLEDLESLSSAKTLTMRINSVGGDAFAAIPIHNRLRELKAHKTAIVDGVAMSGGSLIMCAADVVKVNGSSLIMIHNCWTFLFGGYNAEELRKAAGQNDGVDKAQVSIYKRKTGLSEEEIGAMMADETYMTGAEAVEKGFADEVVDGEAPLIAASADCSTLYVNGRAMRLSSPLLNLPDNIPVNTDTKSVKANIEKQGEKIMAKNLEELQKENPELAEAVVAEAKASGVSDIKSAVEEERKRIKEIDEIAALYDEETVREAKFGENPCTAQEMAFEAAKKSAVKGKEALNEIQADFKASGAADVEADPATEEEKQVTPESRMAQGRADARKIQNKEEK